MHFDRKRFHKTTIGVFAVSLLLMVVAGLENSVAPWAPFYFAYIGLATILPLKWGTYRFGPVRNVRWWLWVVCPVIAILLQAVAAVGINVIYARIVVAIGGPERLDDPIIAVPAMFSALFDAAGARLSIPANHARIAYLSLVVAWAGLGEELYFRGYVQGVLRERHSARYAVLMASLLFATRHYMQMLLLLPKYPLFAATAWAAMAIPVGIVLGIIYEKTNSLWLPVAIHYLFNLIPLLAG
jgi:membrane protease YdiL (CAAX protease family)